MMDLEELRTALNWNGVYQGRDCLVVRFEESDAGIINGLRANDQCFYLEFPEYQEHLISFQITRGPETFQYWVLGDRLHRNRGPAKVVNNSQTNVSVISYYQNGLKHRDVGPAELIMRGHGVTDIHPRTQEDMSPDFIAEEFGELEYYWFERGEPPLYPKPFAIYCENGHRIYRTTTNEPLLDDFRGNPAFEVGKLTGNWYRENDALTDDSFRMRFLVCKNYTRSYQHGNPVQHDAQAIDHLTWVIHGETQDTPPEKRENILKNMFSEWNLWEGPLFPNEQEEVFAMGEVNS